MGDGLADSVAGAVVAVAGATVTVGVCTGGALGVATLAAVPVGATEVG